MQTIKWPTRIKTFGKDRTINWTKNLLNHLSLSSWSPFKSKMNGLKNYDDFNHIGTGAFGTVFKARDKKNEGRFVALKKVCVTVY